MKEPVDHIIRPRLPWRPATEPAITECGFDASKVPTITREDLVRRAKDFGKQRTSMLTCMTCIDASQRHGTWEDDPRLALQREIIWESSYRFDKHGHRLLDELLAIVDLIASHPEEFATIMQRRAWNARKKKPTATAKDADPLDARREP